MKIGRILGWLAVSAAPAVIWSPYLFVSRLHRTFSAATDYAVLAVALVAGLAGVFFLVRVPQHRAIAASLYVAVAGGSMVWSLVSLCVSGECR